MSLKILVVEDEESNMKIMTISLQHLGHQVIGAYNPELGLELAASERPDVILMDLMFKGASFDGVEAILRLKRNPLTANIPVVAHTAGVLDYPELAVRGAGADAFLRKPFRRQELVIAIYAAMGAGLPPAEACMRVPAAHLRPLGLKLDRR